MAVPPSLENGRYLLRRPLGKGGTATVFEAWDNLLGTAVAVKLLLSTGAPRPGLRRRLLEETTAMRLVNHRNVLRVFDLRSEGDIDYVVMDLAPGGSLQDRVDARGPLPVEEAVGYLQQVLAALAAAHAARVVHRDVKPQNVLLDAEDVALLADFGIARLRRGKDDDRRTRAGVAMGSFAYMPPEQRLDAHEVDERADVYAAGATLYALLTAGNPVDLFAAGPTSVRWAGIPEALVEVLRRATAQQVEDRYRDARAFGQALTAALATLPEEVRSSPILAFPDLPSNRGRTAPAWQRATREAVTYLHAPAPSLTPLPPGLGTVVEGLPGDGLDGPAGEQPQSTAADAPTGGAISDWEARLRDLVEASERTDTKPDPPGAPLADPPRARRGGLVAGLFAVGLGLAWVGWKVLAGSAPAGPVV